MVIIIQSSCQVLGAIADGVEVDGVEVEKLCSELLTQKCSSWHPETC